MAGQARHFIAGSCVAVVAAFGAIATVGAQEAPMPQQQLLGDVAYLNGGAGDEEVQYVKQSMKEYTLALAFARAGSPRAEYVASVSVTIKDAKGATVFELPSVGPYLLVKLAPGKYSVVASYNDATQTRPVAVGKAVGPLVTFTWK
jgi:hypothetical protein